MIFLKEETINNKEYLFRGESNNVFQRNYSKKKKLRFNSRYYAYEIFDNIWMFGGVSVYELSPNAKIWEYDDEVESFIEEFGLEDYEVPELFKVYKIHTLSELEEYGGNKSFDYHDLYHARQLVSIAYLEDNYSNKYDGIKWYESYDTPEDQIMIWNNSVIKKVPYKEAKDLLAQFSKELDDLGITGTMYQNDDFGDPKYILHK